MPKTMGRDLDAIESLFTLKAGAYPTDVVRYEGAIDVHILETAYRLLCIKYPVLTAVVDHDSVPRKVTIPSERKSSVAVIDGTRESLVSELQRLCADPGIAAELIVGREEGRGCVALAVNHALFDYPSFGALFNELWDLYSKLIAGEEVAVPGGGNALPISPAKLIRERWDRGYVEPEFAAQIQATADLRKLFTRDPSRENVTRESTIRFTHEQSDAVRSLCRRAGVSIHGVVCGAILLAQRANHDLDSPLPMLCMSAVNLRLRVTPCVGETETTVFQGIHEARLTIGRDASCIRIGYQIKRLLEQDVHRRDLRMISDVGASRMNDVNHGDIADACTVTNWGKLGRIRHPPGIRIIDRLEGLFQHRPGGLVPCYLVSSYEGRLKIIGMFPSASYSADGMNRTMDRIGNTLQNLGV